MSYLKKLKPAGMLSGGNRKVPVVETSLGNNIFYNHYYGSYFDYKYLFDVLNFYINLISRLRSWRAALRDFRLSLQSPFVHENSLLTKLFRATALCFRCKTPKSMEFYTHTNFTL